CCAEFDEASLRVARARQADRQGQRECRHHLHEHGRLLAWSRGAKRPHVERAPRRPKPVGQPPHLDGRARQGRNPRYRSSLPCRESVEERRNHLSERTMSQQPETSSPQPQVDTAQGEATSPFADLLGKVPDAFKPASKAAGAEVNAAVETL